MEKLSENVNCAWCTYRAIKKMNHQLSKNIRNVSWIILVKKSIWHERLSLLISCDKMGMFGNLDFKIWEIKYHSLKKTPQLSITPRLYIVNYSIWPLINFITLSKKFWNCFKMVYFLIILKIVEIMCHVIGKLMC